MCASERDLRKRTTRPHYRDCRQKRSPAPAVFTLSLPGPGSGLSRFCRSDRAYEASCKLGRSADVAALRGLVFVFGHHEHDAWGICFCAIRYECGEEIRSLLFAYPLYAVSSIPCSLLPRLATAQKATALFRHAAPISASGGYRKGIGMSARETKFVEPDLIVMLCSISVTRRLDHAFLYSAKGLLFLCSED
ncbi:hypothetical protein DPSP01_004742 [Paraphaeosphaeria sporulosa]